jgi:hypothetical protein
MREDDVGPQSADTIKLNFIRCGLEGGPPAANGQRGISKTRSTWVSYGVGAISEDDPPTAHVSRRPSRISLQLAAAPMRVFAIGIELASGLEQPAGLKRRVVTRPV